MTTSLGEEGAGRYGLSIFQNIYGFVTMFLCWYVLSSYDHLTRGRGSWSLYLSIFQYIYGFVTMFLCWFVLSSYDHLTRGRGSWSLWFIHFPVYLWFCNYVFCVGLCCPAMTTSLGEEGAGRYGLSIFQYIYGFVTMFLCWFVLSSYDHLTRGRGSWSLWFIHFPVYLWFCNYVFVLVLFCPAVTTSLGEEGACRYGLYIFQYIYGFVTMFLCWFCSVQL